MAGSCWRLRGLNGLTAGSAWPSMISSMMRARSVSQVIASRTRRSAKRVGSPARRWFQPM